jgi:hypothetical protein
MSGALQLRGPEAGAVTVLTAAGAPLFRYVFLPETPVGEARRPYAHPVYSVAGDVLTNFRPNDHPWHHALSFTATSVDGVNFWGGPSHRSADGYAWRGDHGEQRHERWLELAPNRLVQELAWIDATGARSLLRERRVLTPRLVESGWALGWTSELRNVSGAPLTLHNYHSLGGLAGSHYTGLQFRGARDLLDDHGDASIGVRAEGGRSGEAAVHGATAEWMEWSCQHDTTLRRTRIRFEGAGAAPCWFVRAKNPLAACAFHREHPVVLPPGAVLRLDHLLTFTTP